MAFGGGELPETKNRDEIETWLRDRPSDEDAVVLAARAALRMLPLAGAALDKEPDTGRAEIVLPVFRAAAASWVAAIGPTQADEVRTAAGSAAAAAAADDIAAQGSARSTARAATTAASAAASAALSAASTGGVTVADVSERWRLPAAFPSTLAARGSAMRSAFGHAATRSVALRAATTHSAATRAAATKAVRADVAALDDGTAPDRVAALPLWPDGPPDTVAKAWARLSDSLAAVDEGWAVWTGWYEERMFGRPFDKHLEEAKALVAVDLWDGPPEAVNAEIARLVAVHEAESAKRVDMRLTFAAQSQRSVMFEMIGFVQMFRGSFDDPATEAEAIRFAHLIANALAALRDDPKRDERARGDFFSAADFDVVVTDIDAAERPGRVRARCDLLVAFPPGADHDEARWRDFDRGLEGLLEDLDAAVDRATAEFAAPGSAQPESAEPGSEPAGAEPPLQPLRTLILVRDARALFNQLVHSDEG